MRASMAAMFPCTPLGDGGQCRDRHHREVHGKGDPLGHPGGDADAGKGPRSAAKGQGVDLRKDHARLRQQLVHERQQQFCVSAWRQLMP